jgi:hypothetical protein
MSRKNNNNVMHNHSAPHTRNKMRENQTFFYKQDDCEKKFTHSFFDGGIGVFLLADHYHDLHNVLPLDILNAEGRVSICERFPPIYGIWPEDSQFYPEPKLVLRAAKILNLKSDDIPQCLLTPENLVAHQKLDKSHFVNWTECCLALDLDYGKYTPLNDDGLKTTPTTTVGYNLKEILEDVRVIQSIVTTFGAQKNSGNCLVLIADTGDTLGVHLHFPYTAYYPEECLMIANYAQYRLTEERPTTHIPSGKSWDAIIDLGIYNGTLRMAGVQKVKDCEHCGKKASHKRTSTTTTTTTTIININIPRQVNNNNSGRSSLSSQCKNKTCIDGKNWIDRRYLPRYMLLEDGSIDVNEQKWMDELTTYLIQNRSLPTPSTIDLFRKKSQVIATVTAETLLSYAVCLLKLSTIRMVRTAHHTNFIVPHDFPIPRYPRSWIDFFESIMQAVEPLKSNSFISLRFESFTSLCLNKESHSSNDFSVVNSNNDYSILNIVVTPWSNPAGKDICLWKHPLQLKHQKDQELYDKSTTRGSANSLKHLCNSAYDNINEIKTLFSGKLSEFRKIENKITTSMDPFKHIMTLQNYIRSDMYTHINYKYLQVKEVLISEKYGNCLIKVAGPGQHFCKIANRSHRHNSIYFLIDRLNGCHLIQKCYSSKCANQKFDWGVIQVVDVRLLFAPTETLAKEVKYLTKDQELIGKEILIKIPAFAQTFTGANKKRKISKNSESGTPSTPRTPRTPRVTTPNNNDNNDDLEPEPSPLHRKRQIPKPLMNNVNHSSELILSSSSSSSSISSSKSSSSSSTKNLLLDAAKKSRMSSTTTKINSKSKTESTSSSTTSSSSPSIPTSSVFTNFKIKLSTLK